MGRSNTPVLEYGPGNTEQIGGSRFPFWDTDGIVVQGFGPIIQNSPYAIPSVPPNYGDPMMTGVFTTSDYTATGAAQAPFSMQASPLVWVILAIVGGLFAIHMVHWKGE